MSVSKLADSHKMGAATHTGELKAMKQLILVVVLLTISSVAQKPLDSLCSANAAGTVVTCAGLPQPPKLPTQT